MSQTIRPCPLCGTSIDLAVSLNDGGSNWCSRCGAWHNCVNGPVRFAGGPLACPDCHPAEQARGVRGFAPPPRGLSHVANCDSCRCKLYDQPANRFKCRQCADFDFCGRCVVTQQHNNMHQFFDPNAFQPLSKVPGLPPGAMGMQMRQSYASFNSEPQLESSSYVKLFDSVDR